MNAEWYNAQPKEEVTACNLCYGTRFDGVATQDRYGLPVTAVRCKACGLTFLNPRMTREAYAQFYQNGVYRKLLSKYYGRKIDAESIEEEQRHYAGRVMRILLPFTKARKVGSLLDIGGSTGVVAKSMANWFGIDATVLEPSEEEAQRAKDKGLTVWLGTIEDLEPDGTRFDVILLCQTIDHLLDITGSLRTIRALLEDDGVMFCDVVWNTPIKVDHPYYLDDQSAEDYFRRVGFKVLWCQKDADNVHLNYVLGRG